MRLGKKLIITTTSLFFLLNCGETLHNGSEENPIIFTIIPYKKTIKFQNQIRSFANSLSKLSGLKVKYRVTNNYEETIISFAKNRKDYADIGLLNAYSYILANDLLKTVPIAKVKRKRKDLEFKSVFITSRKNKIRNLKALKNRKLAYVARFSTTGFIYPSLLLNKRDIKPGSIIFSGTHRNVVIDVYNDVAEVGATYAYFDPSNLEKPVKDSRDEIIEDYPDIKKKTVLFFNKKDFSFLKDATFPSEVFVVRSNLKPEIRKKLFRGLMKLSKSPSGKELLWKIADIDKLERAEEEDFLKFKKLIQQDTGKEEYNKIKNYFKKVMK
jgi:phosphonate transport system substrate-binding protein